MKKKLKGPVTCCNFSCNSQRNSTFDVKLQEKLYRVIGPYKHVGFLFIAFFFISYQDANASNDLPPLIQKSSVLRAASALGIVGEQKRSIAFTPIFTPHKAWIPLATTVSSLVCILSSLGDTVLDGLMCVSFVSLTWSSLCLW